MDALGRWCSRIIDVTVGFIVKSSTGSNELGSSSISDIWLVDEVEVRCDFEQIAFPFCMASEKAEINSWVSLSQISMTETKKKNRQRYDVNTSKNTY